MEHEHFDLEELIKERRRAVEESLRPIDSEELNALKESLFTDPLHPWAEPFHQFAEENRGDIFYHAITHEGVQVIYCRAKDKGIWFLPGTGVGLIQPMALQVLREVVDARGK